MVYYIKKRFKPRHKIALFLPPDSPAIRAVQNGFLETLTDNGVDYRFSIYNTTTNDSKTDEEAIKEAIKKEYTLIFTVGRKCTQIVKKITTEQHKPIPTVFCGIENPVEEGFVRSKQSSDNHLTGIIFSKTNLKISLQYLLFLKPDLKKVIFLYNTSYQGSVDKTFTIAPQTIHKFIQKNINIYGIPMQHNKITSELPQHLQDVDAVIITRGHLFLSNIKTFVTLSHQYNFILCSSDLESVKHGATIGIGDSEYINGMSTALNYALPIIEHATPPSQLPLTKLVWNHKVMLNAHAVSLQKSLPFTQTINKVIDLKNGILT